jgi:hypothetical protein
MTKIVESQGSVFFIKQTVRHRSSRRAEYITSTFDIQDSIFDIRYLIKLRKVEVSFSIKLAASAFSGSAHMKLHEILDH